MKEEDNAEKLFWMKFWPIFGDKKKSCINHIILFSINLYDNKAHQKDYMDGK